MKEVPHGVGTQVAEVGVHVIVFEGCDFSEEAEGVTADQSVPFEKDFSVSEWDYFVLSAVQDDQKAVYAADGFQNAEAIVGEIGVGSQLFCEEGVDGGEG